MPGQICSSFCAAINEHGNVGVPFRKLLSFVRCICIRTVTLAFNNPSGIGGPGTGTFKVDGKVVATQTMERTIPPPLTTSGRIPALPWTTGTIKCRSSSPGKIAKLAIKVEPPVLTEQDKRKLAEAQRLARDGK